MSDEPSSGALSIPFQTLPANMYVRGPVYFCNLTGKRMSQEEVDAMHQRAAERDERCKPNWAGFMGENDNQVPDYGGRRGGALHVAGHLGKPLSDRLWEDAIQRLQVRKLSVFRPGDMESTAMSLIYPVLHIYLDEAGNVRDLAYWP